MAEHELGSEKPDSGPTILLSPEAEARYERITRNLAEMTSLEIMRKQLSEGGVLKGYWGM